MERYSLYGLDEDGRLRMMEARYAPGLRAIIALANDRLSACERVEVWGREGRVYLATREDGERA